MILDNSLARHLGADGTITKVLENSNLTSEESSRFYSNANGAPQSDAAAGRPNGDDTHADGPFCPLEQSKTKRVRPLKMATGDVDRAGDILVLAGMDATNFQKNPQFLWQHGSADTTVNTIGRILSLEVVGNALIAEAEYADENISPLAEQIFRMDTAGYLPANSIGFRPIEFEENDYGGYTFTKWELIECSKVELPMNPNAIDDPSSQMLSLEDATAWLLR